MFNIADIIAVAIIVLLAVWGMKKGLVRSIFSLGSFLLSLILALSLYPAVSGFLEDSTIGDYVRINVYKVFDSETAESQATQEEPDLHLPQSLSSAITGAAEQATETVKESMAETVASLALKLLGILAVFLLVRVILWVVLLIFDAVAKLPVLKSANKLLGGALGAVYGVLAVYLILALLTLVTTFQAFNKPTELVLESKIVSQMYHQNILLQFLN
ncbi:MAG: CvpA family protein [Ruminococcaceae bacterium]|nr:CvpA family protein [Oscillospiraceae bacterium]